MAGCFLNPLKNAFFKGILKTFQYDCEGYMYMYNNLWGKWGSLT